MKRTKLKLKKELALLLTLVLTTGLIPVISGNVKNVHAVNDTYMESTSSVTTFATKDELMTVFDLDGDNDTVGKLVFGKNSSGKPQEWYIAGTDSGVSGDNVIIFAASPILNGQQFNFTTGVVGYYNIWGCTYPKGTTIFVVNANHYGESYLRNTLKKMESNTRYFSIAEQTLMNPTPVENPDYYNLAVSTPNYSSPMWYITTDKLYAAMGGFYDTCKIYAGSDDSVAIAANPYWNSGDSFWLRTCSAGDIAAACAWPYGEVVGDTIVEDYLALRPVSNLNLSSVLFASAAPVASASSVTSGMIADGMAMTLRLNGSSKAIGSAVYYGKSRIITVQKDANAAGTVYLVVQGNDGINNWYYKKEVSGTDIKMVTADEIETELNQSGLSLSSDIVLSDCKIWMETTSDDGMTYASMAATVNNIVSAVKITGIDAPTVGAAFDTEALCGTTGIATTAPYITYTKTSDGSVVSGNADWNTAYTASLTLDTIISKDMVYVFDSNVAVTINDAAPVYFTPNADGTLTVTKEFTTARRKITSITAPSVPTDENNTNTFTNYYTASDVLTNGGNSELGTQAEVTLEGTADIAEKKVNMDVEWTLADGTSYNEAPGAENIFKWTVIASQYVDYDIISNNIAMSGTVTVMNRAAAPVTITGKDAFLNYYTGMTIDVSDYFIIDENAGTATYLLVGGLGAGEGTFDGTILTVERVGIFNVLLKTDANGNYAEGKASACITVNNGAIESIAADYSGTYDGNAHGITVTVTNPEDTRIFYSTDGINFSIEKPQFTNEGTYMVYYKIEKDNYTTVTGSKTVTIAKKDIAITADEQTVMWGVGIDQSKYTLSEGGLAAGDTISSIILTPNTAELTDNGIVTADGLKIINAAGDDVTGNYSISYTNGTLKVSHNTTLVPTKIEAVKTKTVYTAGDTLNVDDMTITAYYEDGCSEKVTDYTTNADSIDMSAAGEKTLTVTLVRNGGMVTRDIIVTVAEAPKKDYEITDSAGNSHTQGSSDSITIKGNGEPSKLVSVKVDGNVKPDAVKSTAPSTGDNAPLVLLFMILCLSIAGIAAAFHAKYKKYEER